MDRGTERTNFGKREREREREREGGRGKERGKGEKERKGEKEGEGGKGREGEGGRWKCMQRSKDKRWKVLNEHLEIFFSGFIPFLEQAALPITGF